MYVYFMVIDFKNVMKRICLIKNNIPVLYLTDISFTFFILFFLLSSQDISNGFFLGIHSILCKKKIINLSFLTLIQLIHLRKFYFLIQTLSVFY